MIILRLFFFVAVAWLLSSCYSFNHIQLPDHSDGITEYQVATLPMRPMVEVVPVKEEPKALTVVAKKDISCAPFVLPILPRTPELPILQLTKIGPNNGDALNSVLRQHVDELRMYITKVKQTIRTSHDVYLTACYLSSGVRLLPASITDTN